MLRYVADAVKISNRKTSGTGYGSIVKPIAYRGLGKLLQLKALNYAFRPQEVSGILRYPNDLILMGFSVQVIKLAGNQKG
ncbi:MAG: hypothetical protein ACRD2B_09485 [Terriglobia bacterium]